jgi:cystathionine gamma-synthase
VTLVADNFHPVVKQVNYPKHSSTRPFYDRCRTPNGGYGGLLSATFFCREDAVAFFDNLATAKGPSLGTNFTLRSVAFGGQSAFARKFLLC